MAFISSCAPFERWKPYRIHEAAGTEKDVVLGDLSIDLGPCSQLDEGLHFLIFFVGKRGDRLCINIFSTQESRDTWEMG